MEKLFSKFNFLLLIDDEEINKKFNFSKLNNSQIQEIIYELSKLTDIYFFKKILNENFKSYHWKIFSFIVKKYHEIHNNNLAIPDYLENLKPENLNKFIINFIQSNFILSKNNINISKEPNKWYTADKITPFKMFSEDLILFENYNLENKDFLENPYYFIDNIIISHYSEDKLKFFKNIYKYYSNFLRENSEEIDENLLRIIYQKNIEMKNLIREYQEIYYKIILLERYANENIKNKKTFSFKDIIEELNKENLKKKEILDKKNNAYNNILLYINNKNKKYL